MVYLIILEASWERASKLSSDEEGSMIVSLEAMWSPLIDLKFSMIMGSIDVITDNGSIASASWDVEKSQLTAFWQAVPALTKSSSVSSLCASLKARMFLIAQVIRSGMKKKLGI